MPNDADEVLRAVRQRIQRHADRGIGEQNTKAVLIAPVLRALGWELEDLDEVRLEYKRRASDKPVDYALFISGAPRLFVEAKGLGENLEDRRWASQIIGYATVAGVRWVVLTNGDEYRIYNSHAEVPVEEKLFRRVRVSEEGSRPWDTIALLSKESIAQMEELWREDFVNRQVEDALASIFTPAPDPGLIRLVRRRVPSLSPAQIKSALSRLTLRFERGEPVTAVEPRRRSRRESAGTFGDATPWRGIAMRDVLASGLVRPPVELERPYKGTVLRAKLEVDGRVTFAGHTYDSLSTAGGMARASIIGTPPGRPYPQTNGWTFWQFRDSDGQMQPLDILRRTVFQRRR